MPSPATPEGLSLHDDELHPPVQLATTGGEVRRQRSRVSVTCGFDSPRIDARLDEVVGDGARPVLGQLLVLWLVASVVRVPFDTQTLDTALDDGVDHLVQQAVAVR